ncbi:elongator complex protein 5-like isoform X2 [Rhopilema esculentum]|uniref:elongator complex protein 5-like isoform X2 n=1 Tax=Rhopilema esculentum TaxID=499914 RepID=UPI0031D3D480
MLLQTVIEESSSAKICVFDEKRNVKIYPFLKSTLNAENLRCESLHFICFKKPPNYYADLLPATLKINFYDGFSDPVGWGSSCHNESKIAKVNVGSDLLKEISERCKKNDGSTEKVSILLDDVSMLCRHKSISEVCRMIASLANEKSLFEIERVIVFVQRDLLPEMAVNALRYIADAYVLIDQKSAATIRQGNSSNTYKVDVIVKKKSGKVVREIGLYSFTKNSKLIKLKDISLTNQEDDETEQNDPTANLPFNLKLSDSEKAARSQVRLPYMFDTEQKAARLNKPGSGKIIYQPDEGDDFDEEDPDDDLDI